MAKDKKMSRYQGTVTSIVNGQYGFIWSQGFGRRIFFHCKNFLGMNPNIGDTVEYELQPSIYRGKPDEAVNVTPVTAESDAKAGV